MIRLGEKQNLVIVKTVDFGVYLAVSAQRAQERILLPAAQVPKDSKPGDSLEVFVYRDSEDRLIATTRTPKLVMGQVAELTVADVGKIGAFLDWGLEKDLFLPYSRQSYRVKTGDRVLVSLYIDKSDRLCATTNVYENLSTDSPYQRDDRVRGRVYEISDNFGAFVAVDNQYSALIPKRELYGDVTPGTDIEARVVEVLEDGRLTLSVREKAYLQMDRDGEKLLALLDSYDGVLPFTEKADPEVIRRETGMSKKEFKRAVGHLLKAGAIEINGKVIRKV
ncbi:MAG: S1-like domain-containing RNA-binding protein [Clostridium sp.]|nr:S1-like domain-containing RNA-binding protein [Acetatifactor muris]MCM1526778.1 S1-like domain-containing RNA-binding protein [Bacteroides sp.]MCM1562762.1 S1-like domain-containing RNA-binding protein [Clostridium sp.]